MTAQVVCLGDVMIDILATLPAPLAIGSDTPSPIRLSGGGSAANTACWLTAAGIAAVLFARIGDDTLGGLARSQLTGVDARLAVDPALPTGSCIVLVDPSGERTMVPDAGANTALTVADVDSTAFTPGSHLHLSAYSLFHSGRPAARHCLELARSADMTISVDAASAAPLRAFGADRFAAEVGRGVLILANADEAAVLTGTRDIGEATGRLADQFGAAAVKNGAQGAVFADATGVASAPALAIDVIDTTGAGDAFAAGLLAARLSGVSALESLLAAHRWAARACVRTGARP